MTAMQGVARQGRRNKNMAELPPILALELDGTRGTRKPTILVDGSNS